MREEELISTAKAFLCLLARAEPEYLEYVRPKLLPHRLFFDRISNFSTHSVHSKRPSHPAMADTQPSASFLPTSRFQVETDEDSDFSNTKSGDQYFPHDAASIDSEIPDWNVEENNAASQIIQPKLLSCPTHVNIQSPAPPTCITPLERLYQDQDNQGKLGRTPYDTISVDAQMLDTLPTASNSNLASMNFLDSMPETSCLTPPTERRTSVTLSEKSSAWNLSPAHDSRYIWSASSPPLTQYLQAFERLDSQYGGNSKHGLRNLNQIIELGDHFLRRDAVAFVHSLRYRCSQSGLWYRPPLSNPMTGSIAEKTLKSLRCAETTEQDTIVSPIRLRMARIFLYHYMEQKVLDVRANRNITNPCSRGKDVTSIVTDLTLHDIYGRNNEPVAPLVSKQRRESLKTHKAIGKRWSFLAAHLGIGILLTCDPSLETYINKKNFTKKMIVALVTYVVNVYPQGIQINRIAGPLVESIMKGTPSSSWPGEEVLNVVEGYRQKDEKDSYHMEHGWQFVEPPRGFIRVLSL
ncbi:hypothetical protein J3E71DRAFT_241095 [Bipolaris maydis]|nr:hypothetical protein J3E71DRAFT_241095 [Bipolaris maydis]